MHSRCCRAFLLLVVPLLRFNAVQVRGCLITAGRAKIMVVAPRERQPTIISRARGVLTALKANFLWNPTAHQSVPGALEAWAKESPQDVFLLFEGERWTVGQFNAEVDRHAWAYRNLGVGRGEVVALVMDNRPAFLFHLYGMFKLGVIASLVNPGLEGQMLMRAIESCTPKAIMAGDAQARALSAISMATETPHLPMYLDAEGDDRMDGFTDFSEILSSQPSYDIPDVDLIYLDDRAAFVYTSGTTGFPKPAVVKHHRLFRGGTIFGGFAQLSPHDCLYCCLPLYHGNGTILATPMAIMNRCRLALARRFSLRRFWSDCRSVDATIFIYVGELCRYLDNAPPGADDNDHQIDRIIGNGLRPDLWNRLKERFGIRKVIEFYAATEGNAETINFLGVTGSCGMLLLWKMALIRYDIERQEPVRGPKGFCQRVGPGEVGLLIGKIKGNNEYVGYADPVASQRKVLVDVFKRGDQWFHSGDLLRHDWLLHMQFIDRLGDTFRWKGENVSTREVAEVIDSGPGVTEAAVYGVLVPGQEGRAGMAAIVVDESFDPQAFFEYVNDALPRYAQPRFLRIVPEMDLTGTFKHKTAALKEQGYAASVSDPLLLRDPRSRCYLPLDDELRRAVNDGSWPL